ncbi:hypothetical protein D9615_005573 [Tricholomella constricta]|uniref:RING-type domain-containing protein n=1 Tax=Tricholomella constricta TaxID=117010 RepID=A0A8H5HEA2_9AGAR|nr:hypothetical protein D9615_005573 [Tricholomella constricta]
MSSSCPPQLHLELPPNTTSFKRSFDQFGFDLESPLGGSDGAGASGSDGNDRNKRARSASSFSDDDVSIGGSQSLTLASGSSSMSDAAHGRTGGSQSALGASRPVITAGAPLLSLNLERSSLEPPRLPTPEIQDIDMADYPLVEAEDDGEPVTAPSISSAPIISSQADESYRISLERFNAFDTQISALRQSRSPSVPRSPTPPPVLPPLELLGEETPINTNNISFLHPPARPSPPLPNSLYGFGLPRSQRPHSRTAGRDEVERSTTSRYSSQSDEVWDRTSQDMRPPGISDYQPIWSDWHAAEELENDDGQDEAAPSPGLFMVRNDSPVPAIGALRSPSPLFDDLEELQRPPSARTTNTTPPTLPPIQDHNEAWADSLETLRSFSFGGSRSETSARPTQLSRISIPTSDSPSLRDRTAENRSSNSTAGPSTISDNNTQTHTLPSPFSRDLEGWLDDDSSSPSWFPRPSREESTSSQSHRNTNNNLSSSSSGNNGASSSSSVLDSYTASRLEALHGLGEALQGIGRVLQESEISLRPFLDTSTSVESSSSSSSHEDAMRYSFRHNLSDGRRPYTSNTNVPEDEEPRDSSVVPRRLRLSAPSPPSPLENHMHPWLIERSRDESPPPVNEASPRMSLNEYRFRDLHSRYTPADRTRRHGSDDIMSSSWFNATDEVAVTSSETDHPSAASPESPVRPSSVNTSPWASWSDSNTQAGDSTAPDTYSPTLRYPERTSSGEGDSQSIWERYLRHQGPSRSIDAGLSGVRHNVGEFSSSSSAVPPTYVSTPSLLRLRSRPYVSHASTHTHSHSHSIYHSRPAPRPREAAFAFSESAADSRRRIARLGMIQMQRQMSSRTPPVETSRGAPPPRPPVAPRWALSGEWRQRQPFRPSAFMPSRANSDHGFENREPHMQEGHLRSNVDDNDEYGASSLLSNFTDGGRGRTERVNERLGPRPGRLSPTRSGNSTTPASESHSLDIDHRMLRAALLRDFGPNRTMLRPREPSPDREHYRGYLPIPSLPSPDLDGVFEFTAPPATDNRELEQQRPSGTLGRVPSSLMRQTPSPPSREPDRVQRDRSPTRRLRTVRPPLNPESFAPGPFRNTIQRFYDANLARERFGLSQSQTQPQTAYTAPSIPPLPFEADSTLPTYQQESILDAQFQAYVRGYPASEEETNETSPPSSPYSTGRRGPPDDTFTRRPPQTHRPSWSMSGFFRPTRPANSTSTSVAQSRPSDLHNFLSRRPRMEASRLDESENPRPSTTRGDEEGFNHALEVLRHDGLSVPRSQELINRYHRERQREPRPFVTPASPWGIIEQGGVHPRRTSTEATNTNDTPSVRSLRRRMRRQPADPFSTESDVADDIRADATSVFPQDAEHARFLRARRFRRPELDLGPVFPSDVHEFIRVGARRGRALGDYMRDEDFDESYESLLSLAASLGEAKPRCTPDGVISSLETGLFKDWKTADSDHRCPICLDDYQPDDSLLKLADCSHWLHRECLQQWLRSATTCPVCRKTVSGGSSRRGPHDPSNEAGPSRRRRHSGNGPGGGSGGGGGAFGGSGSSDGPGMGDWMPPWRYGPGS